MKTAWNFLILLLVYFIPHALLLTYIPMKLDECLYAVMIEEQIEHPTLVPTFLGYEVGWKPPVFFWLAGFFVSIARNVESLPLDVIYKLPNVIFGFVNLILFYFLVKRVSKEETFALISGIAYALTPLIIFLDVSVLTDTLSLTFTLAAVLAYLSADERDWIFLIAGVFGFVGFFTKQVNALLAPVVMGAYFFQNNKRVLTRPFFIISVLLLPAAFLLNYSLYENEGQARAIFSDLIENKIINNVVNPLILFASLDFFFMLAAVWLCFSVFGFVKWWKENYMFSTWYILMIFPLIAGVWMPWYFLPVMPAIIYFAMKNMAYDEKKNLRLDRFFWMIFAILTLLNLFIGLIMFYYWEKDYDAAKIAGEMMVSKENVLIIGGYSPTIFVYKMLNEKRIYGQWLDYGLVFSLPNTEGDIRFEDVRPFIENYYGPQGENIADGNFESMFFERRIYRKDTNVTKFDYVVLFGVDAPELNGSMIYNESGILVYRTN